MKQSWLFTILTSLQVSYLAQALPLPDQQPELHTLLLLVDGIEPSGAAAAAATATTASTSVAPTQTPTCFDATQTVPDTTGSIHSSLETGGNPPVQPFATSIPTVTGPTLSPSSGVFNTTHAHAKTTIIRTLTIPSTRVVTVVVHGSTTFISTTTPIETALNYPVVNATNVPANPAPTIAVNSTNGTIMTGQNVFLPVGTGPVPSNIPSRGDHPVPRLGINQTTPIPTNKFYANLFLSTQAQSAFVHPYSVAWSKGAGNAQSWGLAISHIDASQRVFGPQSANIPGNPVSYYINPVGIQSVIMSATELGSSTALTTDSLDAFSVNLNLEPQASTGNLTKRATGQITFPLVQGMAFVTGIYTGLQPTIQSSVFFRQVTAANMTRSGIFKYRITLEDSKTWLMYAIPANSADPNFQLASNTLLQGPTAWSGFIQIAKNPTTATEAIYDAAAGVFPTSGQVSGTVSGSQGTYSLSWTKGGPFANNTSLLMFALPHHLESFASATSALVTPLQLQTTTKGVATAIVADSWTLVESSLPTGMGFGPWSPTAGSITTLSSTAINAIQNVAASEISQNMSAQSDLNSMYYSGKALSKFASIIYTVNDLLDNPALAVAGLDHLKSAFDLFTSNQQQFPLIYDTAWKGVVSSASYVTGDSGQDFGNSYYNDHHFHYGYFIHAAAVIGALDSSWLATNKDWVNALVRDVSTPVTNDPYFPFSRSFDWYHGHSWAKGLFESADSKDEESTSEDAMFAYGLKMWGKVTGDPSMEARGNLMLSILSRSLQNYFLLDSNNTNQPSNFIANKVTGILFDNKVDHTTYFGTNLEYIQGIHMIPINPFSALTRTNQFVTEEWNQYFADGAVDPASSVVGGWKGILYANLAIINPVASWTFFSQQNFDPTWLDGGASQTWYMAYAAGLGGAPS